LDQLLDLQSDSLMELVHARARRRFSRGLKRKPLALIKKLRKAKKEAPPMEKPEVVKTHLRNMIVVPEMIGSVIGVYNGKTFNQIEVKVCMSLDEYIDSNLYYIYILIFYMTYIKSFYLLCILLFMNLYVYSPV
jgi:ribosomal protein uS19